MEDLKPKGVRPFWVEKGLTPFRLEPLTPDRVLDCYGLLCPIPLRKTAQALGEMRFGQVLQVIATDEWFGPDLEAWLRRNPHDLLSLQNTRQEIHAFIRKSAARMTSW